MYLMQDTGSLYFVCKTDTQAMYVEPNNEARLRCYCCCKKAINTTYYECVSVALGMKHP